MRTGYYILLALIYLLNSTSNLDSNISSTEIKVNRSQVKPWNTLDRLSIIGKSGLSDKIKRDFFQVISILRFGCTTWMQTKCMEKKLDSNYTRMLRTVLDYRAWKQHTKKQPLYSQLPPISKTIHGWLVGFYGISTFVGYLTPNTFLRK